MTCACDTCMLHTYAFYPCLHFTWAFDLCMWCEHGSAHRQHSHTSTAVTRPSQLVAEPGRLHAYRVSVWSVFLLFFPSPWWAAANWTPRWLMYHSLVCIWVLGQGCQEVWIENGSQNGRIGATVCELFGSKLRKSTCMHPAWHGTCDVTCAACVVRHNVQTEESWNRQQAIENTNECQTIFSSLSFFWMN